MICGRGAVGFLLSYASLLASTLLLAVLVRDAIRRRKDGREGYIAFVGGDREPSSIELATRPPSAIRSEGKRGGYFTEVRAERFMESLTRAAKRTAPESGGGGSVAAVSLEPHLVPRDVVGGAKSDLRRTLAAMDITGYRLKAFEVREVRLEPGRTLLEHIRDPSGTGAFFLDVHACAHRRGKADAHCFRVISLYSRRRGASSWVHAQYLGAMPEFLSEKN